MTTSVARVFKVSKDGLSKRGGVQVQGQFYHMVTTILLYYNKMFSCKQNNINFIDI